MKSASGEDLEAFAGVVSRLRSLAGEMLAVRTRSWGMKSDRSQKLERGRLEGLMQFVEVCGENTKTHTTL
eukprot:127860-Amorphochlora_amoeboformis.AAC.2